MQNIQPQETNWTNLQIKQIKGQKRQYKIRIKEVLLRTQNYIVYKGLSRQIKNNQSGYHLQHVTIKKYSKKPNQIQIFKQNDWIFGQEANGLIQFFQYEKNYYLIINLCHGTLYDKISHGIREFKQAKELPYYIRLSFITQLISNFIDLLKFYQQKRNIIFNGLRPFHILYAEKTDEKPLPKLAKDAKISYYKKYIYYFHDFTNATIQNHKDIKTKQMNFQIKDYAYIPPECLQGSKQKGKSFSAMTDIWSFGCILYQIFNCGETLIPNPEFNNKNSAEKQKYISQKLIELGHLLHMKTFNSGKDLRFRHGKKMINILQKALKFSPKQRIKHDQIVTYIQQIYNQQDKKDIPLVNNSYQVKSLYYQHKIIANISLQIFRLNHLYDNIMTIFEQLYFRDNIILLQKFQIYPILKMVSCYFLQAFHKAKDKARSYARNESWDKYSQIRKIPQEKRLFDIKQKAAQKVKKQFQNMADQILEKQSKLISEHKQLSQLELQLSKYNQQKVQATQRGKLSIKIQEKKQLLKKLPKQIQKLKNHLSYQTKFYSKFPQIDDDKIIYPSFLIFKMCQFYMNDICKLQNITIYLQIMSILVYSLDDSQFRQLMATYKLKLTDDLFQKNPQLPLCELLVKASSDIKTDIWKILENGQKQSQQNIQKQMKAKMRQSLKRYKYINYGSN